MKNKKFKVKNWIAISAVFGLFVFVSIASATTGEDVQPASDIFYDENLVVNATAMFDSIKVGKQGVGGVTFFNGTIVNETTDEGGAGIPVTFGDDVRIDGILFRAQEGGSDNLKIGDTLQPATDSAYDLGTATNKWNDLHVVDADISGKTTVNEFEGPNGVQLPVAYGYCDDAGAVVGGTNNFTSCTWDAGVGRYEIAIDGENYYFDDYVTIVTPTTSSYIPRTNSIGDELLVYFVGDDGTTKKQTDFAFVMYKIK